VVLTVFAERPYCFLEEDAAIVGRLVGIGLRLGLFLKKLIHEF
jgi:hypothetical protein